MIGLWLAREGSVIMAETEDFSSPFMLDLPFEVDFAGRPGEVPTCFNVFGNPTRIAWAAGLDIELPDVDSTDRAYWAEVHRTGWKQRLEGKIVSPWQEGDPDYAFLTRIGDAAEVWFDIEEGIKVMSRGKHTPIVLDWLATLARKGVPMTFPDTGRPSVWAQMRVYGAGIKASDVFLPYGMVMESNDICFAPSADWIRKVSNCLNT
jgi:hypothetical protein